MKKTLLFSCFIFLFCGLQTKAQHLLQTQGQAVVNQLGDTILLRGMGLGGWMLQEGYMLQTAGFANAQYQIRNKIEELIGPANTDLFYDTWLQNHCTKADIDSLSAWGFNSVRLPMHYNLYTLPIEDEPVPGEHTWLDKGFEMTDNLIEWCKQNEMYVILDLHAAPGGQGQDQGISDYDPTKPSLWESPANQDKTVALWKRLAERYADEEWVAGYDLLNEPNWNLPGGTALRNLYEEITDSIRTVDQDHIIIIEGNWFANDFTGLTPPWDDNMMYGPHKYWSTNDKGSIQWVLDIREEHNVPLYLGESGENSNTWFRDAIKLLEDHHIGWAWWPMKKIESISGPTSVIKTSGYQALLDYWNDGGTPPSAAFAQSALMEIADLLKIENCVIQKDVVDAMFRQVQSTGTIPYNTQDIPGVVYATDFSMGVVGEAYFDKEVANYHLSSGNFTAWNNGWIYRNDGVDIERCEDDVNTNGFNVGWTEAGEWIQYDVNVAETGVYDVELRVATTNGNGRFRFSAGDAVITDQQTVPVTGGWQTWSTTTVPNVILTPDDKKIKIHFDASSFNFSSMNFVESDTDISEIPAEFQAAYTVDENTIRMNINKMIDPSTISAVPSNFQIFANGNSIPITAISVDEDNPRIAYFTVDFFMRFTDILRISYNGSQVATTDGTPLQNFTMENVVNTLPVYQLIPGRVQAESFVFQEGMALENAIDLGGGQNIGFLDPGDYADYRIQVENAGTYKVDFRNASLNGNGSMQLQLVDSLGNVTSTILTQNFSPTGGWQTWTTTTNEVELPEGRNTLRVLILQGPFNLNWMDFYLPTSVEAPELKEPLAVFPNPSSGAFNIEGELLEAQDVHLRVIDLRGRQVIDRVLPNTLLLQESINLNDFPSGPYFLMVQFENGSSYTNRLLKTDN